ncbi:MAG: SGNH/GDSL hydrolase family protein, partial [Acidimicrobiales bacterium]
GLLAVTAGPATASSVAPAARPTSAQLAASGSGLASGPGAHATQPVRAMLVGDSIGVTLAEGLQVGSLSWGVLLDNQAALGCDLDPTTTVNINGAPGPAGQGCAHWASHWAQLVRAEDPDVVAVEMGRFETANRLFHGRWVSVGNPAFDAHLQAELVKAIDILSSRGAKVVLMTLPYVDQTTEQPDGSPWPINDPARTRAWNALLARAAAERPGTASVLNVNAMLDPGGPLHRLHRRRPGPLVGPRAHLQGRRDAPPSPGSARPGSGGASSRRRQGGWLRREPAHRLRPADRLHPALRLRPGGRARSG